TIGAVKVSSFSPANGTSKVARNSYIYVSFDQQVDHDSAQQHFSVNPPLSGNIVWEGNQMVFQPTQLMNFQTTYTAAVAPGVKTVYGLDSKEAFSTAFTTVSNTTIIPGFSSASFDKQDYSFSCTVAATKMALRWKNIYLSEYDIIYNRLGADQSSMDCTSGTCYWGNPNAMYLGYPNGSGTYGTGQSAYGVHWLPIINLFTSLGIQTELKRNWNVYGLAETIDAGHPVQIWWWNGISNLYGNSGLGGSRIDWIDRATGQSVEAIHGMHSVLVVGFNGEVSSPTSFIVLDPWWGYNYYSIAKFNSQWPKLQNTGLIIY
ncbi:Ig-like domain-containing protein, partial [Candidatus Dojkabacteria bacterium]|nr:Ig-like domain-containing protein [Candidatus Dojkabacteria bacterium]